METQSSRLSGHEWGFKVDESALRFITGQLKRVVE